MLIYLSNNGLDKITNIINNRIKYNDISSINSSGAKNQNLLKMKNLKNLI